MAGDTTRVLRTFVIPSFVAVCGFVILLMRKRKQSAKLSLTNCSSSKNIGENTENSCGISIDQENSLEVVSSSLSTSPDCSGLCFGDVTADMLLKEKIVTSKSSEVCLQQNVSETRSAETSTLESKAGGIPNTCGSRAGTDVRITNGVSHCGTDKKDKNSGSSNKQKKTSSVNGSHSNGSYLNLVNGVNSLKIEDTNERNSLSSDISDEHDLGGLAAHCNGAESPVEVNGKMSSFCDESDGHTVNEVNGVGNGLQKEDLSSRDISSMSELTCETDYIPKVSTPDSGVSGELQESDGASSLMSEPSSECALSGLGDMLKSPVTSVSSDSGKDGSENQYEVHRIVPDGRYEGSSIPDEPPVQLYEFEIPQELCGYLIGKNGRHVKYIKEESNAEIYIKRHPMFTHLKTCAVSGTEEEIEIALSIIRERFPSETFPELSLEPINLLQPECMLPITLKLTLPEGVTFDAILSATVTPGHFFLQQPTHPTYHTLPLLTSGMSAWYNEFEAPKLVRVSSDAIVAVPFGGLWYRAQVSVVNPDTQQCTVRFLDYGGYGNYEISQLRQMRFEFAQVPFQATECYLGSVTFPDGEQGWSDEAKARFEELAQGQIIQGYIVGYDPSGVPYVHLFTAQGASAVFINRELVNGGFAKWIAEEEIQTASTTQ